MTPRIEVRGLDPILKKLDPGLWSEPYRNFLKRATIKIQGGTRENMPVDTGTARNRVGWEVDRGTPPEFGRVGWLDAKEGTSLWTQARAIEYGTGRMGDPEVSHKSGHWPPGAALDTWAKRHGWSSGWAVAAAIGKRGGLRPIRPLRDALRASLSDVQRYLDAMRGEIKNNWDSRGG